MKLLHVSEAEPALRDLLEEIRHDLEAAFVPDLFRALAEYPEYAVQLRGALAPLVKSKEFGEAAQTLKDATAEAVSRIPLPPAEEISVILSSPLDANIISDLEAIVDADARTLLLATIIHASMRGERSEEPSSLEEAAARSAPPHLRLVEEEGALPPVDELFREIDAVLNTPFTCSEYRAVGKWPYFLEPTWHYLKKIVGTAEYDLAREQVVETAYSLGKRFFDPHRYGEGPLETGDITGSLSAELRSEVSFFARLMPGLLVQMGVLAEIARAVKALEKIEEAEEEEIEQEQMEVA